MASSNCSNRCLCFHISFLLTAILLGAFVLHAQTAAVPGQVPTSAQNAVFGSVPEAKPTQEVLSLSFRDAINRALRQNLAGLLSEYNTIEARGEKWQRLSEPNVKLTALEAGMICISPTGSMHIATTAR
jgi:hypothetical protein